MNNLTISKINWVTGSREVIRTIRVGRLLNTIIFNLIGLDWLIIGNFDIEREGVSHFERLSKDPIYKKLIEI